jgi:hypothetical protein
MQIIDIIDIGNGTEMQHSRYRNRRNQPAVPQRGAIWICDELSEFDDSRRRRGRYRRRDATLQALYLLYM